MYKRALRVVLFLVSLTGLFAIMFPFLPWKDFITICSWFGITDLPAEPSTPYTEYLFYTMFGASALFGYLYLIAAINPDKYSNIIPILGYALIFIGFIVLYHGIRLKLPPWPYFADPFICFVFGPSIVYLSKKCKF